MESSDRTYIGQTGGNLKPEIHSDMQEKSRRILNRVHYKEGICNSRLLY
jgi:hypothetical protein